MSFHVIFDTATTNCRDVRIRVQAPNHTYDENNQPANGVVLDDDLSQYLNDYVSGTPIVSGELYHVIILDLAETGQALNRSIHSPYFENDECQAPGDPKGYVNVVLVERDGGAMFGVHKERSAAVMVKGQGGGVPY